MTMPARVRPESNVGSYADPQPKVITQGMHVTAVYQGRILLGEVAEVWYTGEMCTLAVRHFDGRPWPMGPIMAEFVKVLNRDAPMYPREGVTTPKPEVATPEPDPDIFVNYLGNTVSRSTWVDPRLEMDWRKISSEDWLVIRAREEVTTPAPKPNPDLCEVCGKENCQRGHLIWDGKPVSKKPLLKAGPQEKVTTPEIESTQFSRAAIAQAFGLPEHMIREYPTTFARAKKEMDIKDRIALLSALCRPEVVALIESRHWRSIWMRRIGRLKR